MPELRKDPITGRWVIIATERAKRPSDFKSSEAKPPVPEKVPECPLCPGNEQMTPKEIAVYRDPGTLPNTPGWWNRVVPNKFPALSYKGDLNRTGVGMYDMMNGVGSHEVIIETPIHNQSLVFMPTKHVEEVLWCYRDRFLDLKHDSRIKYVLIFKNHGKAAGTSLEHPHSQLIAMPIIPRWVGHEIEGGRNYYSFKERCVYCDIIREEIVSKSRLVIEDDHFVAFQAYASRFPFETWILPKRHSSDFSSIEKREIMNLAKVLKEVLAKMYNILDDPPYNYVLHTAPIKDNCENYYHWHIEIIPRLTRIAGFEWGTGMYINPVIPEETAKSLREAPGAVKK